VQFSTYHIQPLAGIDRRPFELNRLGGVGQPDGTANRIDPSGGAASLVTLRRYCFGSAIPATQSIHTRNLTAQLREACGIRLNETLPTEHEQASRTDLAADVDRLRTLDLDLIKEMLDRHAGEIELRAGVLESGLGRVTRSPGFLVQTFDRIEVVYMQFEDGRVESLDRSSRCAARLLGDTQQLDLSRQIERAGYLECNRDRRAKHDEHGRKRIHQCQHLPFSFALT